MEILLLGLLCLLGSVMMIAFGAGSSIFFAGMIGISFLGAYLWANRQGYVGGIITCLIALFVRVILGWIGAIFIIFFAFDTDNSKKNGLIGIGVIFFMSLLPVFIFLISSIALSGFLGYQYGKKQIFQ